MATREQQEDARKDTRSEMPCKLFNSPSGCMMTNCGWLHVRTNTCHPPSCKFFRTSGCKFGDECRFQHAFPSNMDHLSNMDCPVVRHYSPGEAMKDPQLWLADFYSEPMEKDAADRAAGEEDDARIPPEQEEDYESGTLLKCVCCQAAYKNDEEGLQALTTHYTKQLSAFSDNHISAFEWPELADLSAMCMMCERKFSRAIHFWKHVVNNCLSGHRLAKMHTDLRNEIITDFVGYSQELNNKLFFESMKVNMVGKALKKHDGHAVQKKRDEQANLIPAAVRNMKVSLMEDSGKNLDIQHRAKEYEELEKLYFRK